MPVNAVDSRNTSGQYERRHACYESSKMAQGRLSRLAAQQQSPRQCNAVTLLYLSGLLIPVLQQVCMTPSHSGACATQIRPPRQPRNIISIERFPATINAVVNIGSPSRCPRLTTIAAQEQDKQHVASLPSRPSRIGDWLRFPMAAADQTQQLDQLIYDHKDHAVYANGDSGKLLIINLTKAFLQKIGGLSDTEMSDFEFEVRQISAHEPITITRTIIERTLVREKRISFKEHERRIEEHIKQNCAFETDMLNVDGSVKGKVYLLIAQAFDNPFTLLFHKRSNTTLSPIENFTASTGNFALDIITMGVKPVLGGLMASFFRYLYFSGIDDHICKKRQIHLALAQLGTGLTVSSIRYPQRVKKVQLYGRPPFLSEPFPPLPEEHLTPSNTRTSQNRKPLELADVIPAEINADLIAHNKITNTKTVLLQVAEEQSSLHREDVFLLKPTGEYQFETLHQSATHPGKKRVQVVYDKEQRIWHYADLPNTPPLNVHIKSGDSFITLYGENHRLIATHNNQYHILVTSREGLSQRHPVYRHQITKTWHLQNINGHPVFSRTQQLIINQISIAPSEHVRYVEIENANPRLYGRGNLFEVRTMHEEFPESIPLYYVVEMKDKLIPIKKVIRNTHGIHYYAYDLKRPLKQGYRIEWDGERWRLEPWTSPYVSRDLNKRITSNMFVRDLPHAMLSAADSQGINWNGNQGYLKVRGKYVEINKQDNIIVGFKEGKNIQVNYRNQQYHPTEQVTVLSPQRKQLLRRVAEATSEQLKGNFIPNADLSIVLNQMKNAILKTVIAFYENNDSQTLLRQDKKENVHIESVTSDTLEKKRYLFTMNDEYFFLEISLDGKNIDVLQGEQDNIALRKYHHNLSGGDIQHVTSVKREGDVSYFSSSSRDTINNLIRGRIEVGTSLLKDTLIGVQEKYDHEKVLLVANADFLRTSALGNNIFPSIDVAYQAIIDELIPLSKHFPNAIIIPGTIYISNDIPDDLRLNNIKYSEGERTRALKNVINFSSVISPVLHKGKIITIARKGEYLAYLEDRLEQTQSATQLTNLDQPLPPRTTLIRKNVNTEKNLTPLDTLDIRTGTIFAGKTLMPNETTLADWFFCPCKGQNGKQGIENFFSNEFMINDNKFLLILEDEFTQYDKERPQVRKLAYPQKEQNDEVNRYDWVIHISSGNKLDERMQSAGDNYLNVDYYDNSEFSSQFNKHSLIRTNDEERKISVFNFIDE